MFLFIAAIFIVLVILSIFILKSLKEIPVIYARQGKIQETSKLPIPLNPVGMIPIIFAMAFISFPYILAQLIVKFGYPSDFVRYRAGWVELNLNIYIQQPSLYAIVAFFVLVIFFTYFYTLVTFNPDKIADNIQKRGGFVPGTRP
jgi:preprotein translocase subunit SecY